MGYQETVLGYGDNHMEFPYKLIFKRICTAEGRDIPVNDESYEAILEAVNQKGESVEMYLHDDIGIVPDRPWDEINANEDVSNQRMLEVECEEDLYEQVLDLTCFISKKI